MPRFAGTYSHMPKIQFSVNAWSAWSDELSTQSEWLNWANDVAYSPLNIPFDVSSIPSMKRRRMSKLSKMALSTALNCVKNSSKTPNCVFASQHGELSRTVNILRDITMREGVSPTDFSLSVHNSALGLFSIETKNNQVSTTVAAGKETFGFAMLEACILLKRFPDENVLLVYFDEPLPSPLCKLVCSEPALSVSLLLSSSENAEISMNISPNSDIADLVDVPMAKQFMRFLLGDSSKLDPKTSAYSWQWNKN